MEEGEYSYPASVVLARAEANRKMRERLDEAEAIIAELVILKGIKDKIGKNEYYNERQPLAWERARAFLASGSRGDEHAACAANAQADSK